MIATSAYEINLLRQADKYWAPEFHCPWCNDTDANEEVCGSCGESKICPECGKTEVHRAHSEPTAAYPETDYRACTDCGHQWDHQ